MYRLTVQEPERAAVRGAMPTKKRISASDLAQLRKSTDPWLLGVLAVCKDHGGITSSQGQPVYN